MRKARRPWKSCRKHKLWKRAGRTIFFLLSFQFDRWNKIDGLSSVGKDKYVRSYISYLVNMPIHCSCINFLCSYQLHFLHYITQEDQQFWRVDLSTFVLCNDKTLINKQKSKWLKTLHESSSKKLLSSGLKAQCDVYHVIYVTELFDNKKAIH